MSGIGPKRTCACAPQMSAFGGKADMPPCECLLLLSLLGVKQTSACALHMSANDPKRTWAASSARPFRASLGRYDASILSPGGGNATARVHYFSLRRGSHMAACCTCPAADDPSGRVLEPRIARTAAPADRRFRGAAQAIWLYQRPQCGCRSPLCGRVV